MPAMPAASAPDAGRRRSDFDLGDRNGTTCSPELTELVKAALEGFGYRVTVNTHFVGAEAVRKHGAPDRGIHSLQIEMNRSLYMDEEARTPRPELSEVRAHLKAVAKTIADFAQTKR